MDRPDDQDQYDNSDMKNTHTEKVTNKGKYRSIPHLPDKSYHIKSSVRSHSFWSVSQSLRIDKKQEVENLKKEINL